MSFKNCYEDALRADEYSRLEFANTYYLAYRDLPEIFRKHITGNKAVDFGCGTGRSTRFARKLGFEVVGIDIAPAMIAKARQLDSQGDYRLISGASFPELEPASFDLVLSLFTFDNIPGEAKVPLFRSLADLLRPSGKIVSVVSNPEIYLHEWASFSTKDFPENQGARSGDSVKIITTEFADRRPTEDILWTDESYRDVYAQAGLSIVAKYEPLAVGDEGFAWVSETRIAPWVIYVLTRS